MAHLRALLEGVGAQPDELIVDDIELLESVDETIKRAIKLVDDDARAATRSLAHQTSKAYAKWGTRTRPGSYDYTRGV